MTETKTGFHLTMCVLDTISAIKTPVPAGATAASFLPAADVMSGITSMHEKAADTPLVAGS